MLRTGAYAVEHLPVRLGSIALVAPETIVRIQRIQPDHHLVPIVLGENRRGANLWPDGITPNNGLTVDLALTNHQVG